MLGRVGRGRVKVPGAAAQKAALAFPAGSTVVRSLSAARRDCVSASRRHGALHAAQWDDTDGPCAKAKKGAPIRTRSGPQPPRLFAPGGVRRAANAAICGSSASADELLAAELRVRPIQPLEFFFAELLKEPEERFAGDRESKWRNESFRRAEESVAGAETVSLSDLALLGDVREVLTQLLRTRQRGVPLESAEYEALFAAILAGPVSAADDLERCGLPGVTLVSHFPAELLLKNRPALSSTEAWQRYDTFLDLQGLRCLLRDLGIPCDRSAAELIIKISDDMRFQRRRERGADRLKSTFFNNHETLQHAYAYAALGQFAEADTTIMSLWESAPGIEDELPFHLMIREGAGNGEEVLENATLAAILVAEMEARGTVWTMEVAVKLIRSIKKAQQSYDDAKVLDELMLAVLDVVNRRDNSYAILASCGLSCNFSQAAVTQPGGPIDTSPVRVDHRYALRAFSNVAKCLSKGFFDLECLRWILRNLQRVEDLRNREAVRQTCLAVLQISDVLKRLGVEFTRDETNQLVSALILQRQFRNALELINTVGTRPSHSFTSSEAIQRTRFLQLQAMCNSSNFCRSNPPVDLDPTAKSGSFEPQSGTANPRLNSRGVWAGFIEYIGKYCGRRQPNVAEARLGWFQSRFPGVRPPKEAFKMIREAYARNGQAANALRVLELERSWDHDVTAAEHANLMKLASGRINHAIGDRFEPSPATLETLEELDWSNRCKWALVLAVYRRMQESGPAPNSACVTAAIEAARALMDLPRLEEIFRYARQNRVPLDRESWFSLVDFNARARNPIGVENVMRLMQHEGSSPTPGMYVAMLRVLNRCQGPVSVMRHYRRLRSERVHKPTHSEVVQLIMMMHYGKGGDLRRFVEELREMGYRITSEELTENVKLAFHCQNMLGPVIVYLDIMRLFDARLNEEAYEFLLAACSWYMCWETPERRDTPAGRTTIRASKEPQDRRRRRLFFAIDRTSTCDDRRAAGDFVKSLFRDMAASGGFARPTAKMYRYAAATLVAARDWTGCDELLLDARQQGRPLDEVMDGPTRDLLTDAVGLAERAGLTAADKRAARIFGDSASVFRPSRSGGLAPLSDTAFSDAGWMVVEDDPGQGDLCSSAG